MKNKFLKLRLTLDVDLDPQGVSRKDLEYQLRQVITEASINGTLTGETAATVERYSVTITGRRPRKKKKNLTPFLPFDTIKHCKKCGSIIIAARCSDSTCPYHDHPQSTDLNAIYDSVTGENLPNEDAAEQQRRDEKHGLFGDKVDDAN